MLTDLNKRITFDKQPALSKWLYLCDCGREHAAIKANVMRGNTTRCKVCGRKAKVAGANLTRSKRRDHGNESHPLYHVWSQMRARCHNPNHHAYHNYGGRGITICAAWDDFRQFVEEVGERPTLHHSLDRINNDGNYEPSNVRWATAKEQRNNSRQ